MQTGDMDDLLAASSAEDTPAETLEEMQVAVRAWGDRERRGFLRREDFLRVTEELEIMTDALKAELLGEAGPEAALATAAAESSGKVDAGGNGGR